jgi:hypothetical protein
MLIELVAGEHLDPLEKVRAAPEAWADLGIGGAAVTPAEHPSLQRAEFCAPESLRAHGPRESSHGHDPSDHAGAASESTANLVVVDALIDQPEHAPFQRPQDPVPIHGGRRYVRLGVHGRRAVGVAAQTPLIFVKPMWQVAQ